ncbi:MAG: BMC domain-containing protein [Lachnospiraceae bacterium]|nr:BMC domain-containing protein [Lachnospiraceae bacterium]MDY5742272.1 BMC domain-containing protein [Lachnospiraceae bacterium]
MQEAAGILEVFGLTAAFVAADAAAKAGNVTVEALDKNKPANADALPVPLIMCLKIRGSVSDVTMAMEAAAEAADRVTGVVTRHIIPRPAEDTGKMLSISAI